MRERINNWMNKLFSLFKKEKNPFIPNIQYTMNIKDSSELRTVLEILEVQQEKVIRLEERKAFVKKLEVEALQVVKELT